MLFDQAKRKIIRTVQIYNHVRLTGDVATCMYYTGIDPFTRQQVYVARGLRDRKMQRALMQFFKPENYFEVREALIQAGRQDLIGNCCDCLMPAKPPKEGIEARHRQANGPDHYHTVANPAKGEKPGERGAELRKRKGYGPGRKETRRQERRAGRTGTRNTRRGLGCAALAASWQPCRESLAGYAVPRRELSSNSQR
jgi:hypothetical protein